MSNRSARRSLPAGWETLPLGSVVSRVTQRNNVGNRNVLTISARDGLVNQEQFFSKRIASIDLSPYFLLARGDFAYNKSYSAGYPVGVMRRLDRYSAGVVSPIYICFRPNSRLVDSDYLAHYFQAGLLDDDISWIAKEGARNHGLLNVSVNEFFSVPIRVPPLREQTYIADVLSTVDEMIRSTERLMAKLEQVKQGLLHDLFTRGLDSNGRIRAGRSVAPSLYRNSPLGWTPADWPIRLLDEVSERGSGHTPNKDIPSYWNGGIKWVSLADSSKLDQIYISETDKEISELGIANSSAVMHRAGTVILSRDAGVGKSAILAHRMAVSQHFMAWTCGELLDNHYLYYWLQFMKRRFEGIAMGSTIKTIGLPYFRRLSIALPGIDEQRASVEQLLATETTYITHVKELEKQRLLKRGLMDDLLTGRVQWVPRK
jgi:type I restriction enzyme, S subunit